MMQNLDIGLVIDADDPTGMLRVRVIIPNVAADQPLWARVCQPQALGSGTSFLPEAGDEVLVGFLGGDPEMPVVIGSLFNPARPPAVPSAD
ncbi:MAG: hypothetical protein QOH81_1000 [Sphingomonadales bacterium]|jgi:uncharacterized protein involved in type VI secretion and phage assembly|nr:hypothetical protein [Sphingomonadales bacterium]